MYHNSNFYAPLKYPKKEKKHVNKKRKKNIYKKEKKMQLWMKLRRNIEKMVEIG